MNLPRQFVLDSLADVCLLGPQYQDKISAQENKLIEVIDPVRSASMSFDVSTSNRAGWLKTFWTRAGDAAEVALCDVAYHEVAMSEAPTPLRGMSTAGRPIRCSSSARPRSTCCASQ